MVLRPASRLESAARRGASFRPGVPPGRDRLARQRHKLPRRLVEVAGVVVVEGGHRHALLQYLDSPHVRLHLGAPVDND